MDYRLISADAEWVAKEKRRIAADLPGRRRQQMEAAEKIFADRSTRAWALAAEACGSATNRDLMVGEIRSRVEPLIARRRSRPIEADSPQALVSELDEAAAAKLRARLSGTIGLSVEPALKRIYPAGEVACHIIGVTGPVTPRNRDRFNDTSADDLTRIREDYRINDVIGQFGVEKLCETELRGFRGYRKTAGLGQPEEVVDAHDGKDIHLTLDLDLQQELTRKYRQTYPGRNGCAVLLNVSDGTVLAMVSIPTFDLNKYRQDYAHLAGDDFDFPLIHRAIARAYPPGSTAKPLAALAALGSGAITPATTFECQGRLFPDKDYLKCTAVHGRLDLTEAIAKSCNVYFYHVGETVERNHPGKLLEMYRAFGYGEPLLSGLAGESAGSLPPGTQPQGANAGDWTGADRGHAAARGGGDGDDRAARRVHFAHGGAGELPPAGPPAHRRAPVIFRRGAPGHARGHAGRRHGADGVSRRGGPGVPRVRQERHRETPPQWRDRRGDHVMHEDEILPAATWCGSLGSRPTGIRRWRSW